LMRLPLVEIRGVTQMSRLGNFSINVNVLI
jgi:hypothetical protein